MNPHSAADDNGFTDCDEDECAEEQQSVLFELANEISSPQKEDDWVIVAYENKWFPGVVVKCMKELLYKIFDGLLRTNYVLHR